MLLDILGLMSFKEEQIHETKTAAGYWLVSEIDLITLIGDILLSCNISWFLLVKLVPEWTLKDTIPKGNIVAGSPHGSDNLPNTENQHTEQITKGSRSLNRDWKPETAYWPHLQTDQYQTSVQRLCPRS
jgi:hypothetical protein